MVDSKIQETNNILNPRNTSCHLLSRLKFTTHMPQPIHVLTYYSVEVEICILVDYIFICLNVFWRSCTYRFGTVSVDLCMVCTNALYAPSSVETYVLFVYFLKPEWVSGTQEKYQPIRLGDHSHPISRTGNLA